MSHIHLRTHKDRSRAAKKAALTRLATQPKSVRERAGRKAVASQPQGTLTHRALALQTKRAASLRSAEERSRAAQRAVQTKGPKGRSEAAKKAARTRARLH